MPVEADNTENSPGDTYHFLASIKHRNPEAGLIFPSEDASAAAAALRRVIEDPELAAKLGAAGEVRASNFSPEAVTNELFRLYGIDA